MFTTEVEFRAVMHSITGSASSAIVTLALGTAYTDILSALSTGGYAVATVSAGTFPFLTSLQVYLSAIEMLSGGMQSEISSGSKDVFLTWVSLTQKKLKMLSEGKVYLVGTSPTASILPPKGSAPCIVSDGRNPSIDLIEQSRIPSLAPHSPTTLPDAYPGSGGSEYGE